MKLKFPFSRFVVADRSMEPYLRPGDHVLTFNWIMPKRKDVVVYFDGKYFVKRIRSIKGALVNIDGDNKKMSAKMKPIRASEIVGKVILKY